ncbi:MAG: NAD(P)/FAD-dependent oxidoreductase [Deltaproteobacteria bacterium]|nr:NAD(P)/FAD-dependent oxidoreductase [Deltaproteobacteria bacterium]
MDKKTIVILGGGVGGLVSANELAERLREKADVVLIDKEKSHIFSPSFLWLMLGLRRPEWICRGLQSLEKKGVRFINAQIDGIDLGKRMVTTGSGNFNYDYLIISLGAELNPDAVPGFTASAHNLYTLDGTTRLRDALKGFSGGRVVILVSGMPFKCPAAPYEAALLIDYYLRKKGLRDKSDIQIWTPEPLPMPVAGPVLGNAVKDILLSRGIGFNPNTKVISIESDKKEIVFEGDKRVGFDLMVGIPAHKAPQVVKDAGLLGESGWVAVDKGTLRTKYEDVYAIGDITGIKLPNGKALPKAGVFAHLEAEIVAKNITTEINGGKSFAVFDGKGYCFLEMGFGKAGFASGNFYAEPDPAIKLKNPGRLWHWGKIAFEKYWMWKWF